MTLESEVTPTDVVNELAQHGLSTFSNAYGDEWRDWVVQMIREAEADVVNKIGKEFYAPPPESRRVNWTLYNKAVRNMAAMVIIGQFKRRESKSTGFSIVGGYEIDVRAVASNMKSALMEISRTVNDIVGRLTATENPQFHPFYVERTL
ncbi:TPA_asm: hypothetical protein vir520_00063 [Caudoviricetes sp. vir520]|nr:TPA_asm: hypothetical protein vir520_00063 [Caudoviricetes sp. vir520]